MYVKVFRLFRPSQAYFSERNVGVNVALFCVCCVLRSNYNIGLVMGELVCG